MLMLFLTVALVHIVALMSPGPDFFFVSQTAVSRSRKEAMMGVLGITAGVMKNCCRWSRRLMRAGVTASTSVSLRLPVWRSWCRSS